MLSILTYHSVDSSGSVVSVSPSVFAAQMAAISAAGYRGTTLAEAVATRRLTGEWPVKSVVLTFDDGFRNFYDDAMPVLKRYGFTATVFVVSDYMGKKNDWEVPPAKLGSRQILTWAQTLEAMKSGMEIGSHTRTHRDLRRLTDVEVQQEIVTSRSEIENHVGKPVTSFAYPFGEISSASAKCVKETFDAACTTVLHRANGVSFHSLPRIDMYYIRSERDLLRLLSGKLDGYLKIRRLGRTVRRRFSA